MAFGCSKKENLFLPVAPTNLTATIISPSAVKLSWVDNSTNETGFKVERRVSDGQFVEIGTIMPDIAAFTDSILNTNVAYDYRVYSFNNEGKSLTYTNIASVSIATGAPTAVGEEPVVKTARRMIFKAKVNPRNLPTTVTFEYGVGYDFDLSIEASPETIIGDSLISVTADVQGLTTGSDYYYRAKAVNALGTTYSDTIFAPMWGVDFPYTVGQTYGGGVIFYLDESGEHGLVVATDDIGQVPWSYVNTATDATDTAIGTGRSNTDKIVEQLGPSDYAAYLCSIAAMNGYDDWYLPSSEELKQLYSQRGRLPSSLNLRDLYWSSTESSSGTAYFLRLNTGEIQIGDKPAVSFVRAIRSF